jgi:hypothetical protein
MDPAEEVLSLMVLGQALRSARLSIPLRIGAGFAETGLIFASFTSRFSTFQPQDRYDKKSLMMMIGPSRRGERCSNQEGSHD